MTAVRFIALVVEHNMVSRRVSSVYKYSIAITSLIAFIIEISGLSDSVVVPIASSTGQNRVVWRPNAIGEGASRGIGCAAGTD